MKIHIEDLSFESIIGILDFERVNTQKIILNIEIDYEYLENNFINYADVSQLIEDRVSQKKYGLLEDALLDLRNILKNRYSQISTLYIKITKPNILPNAKVSLSNVWNF